MGADRNDDYEFSLDEAGKTATILRYNGTETNVVIPDILGGCPVTAIRAVGM